jgi:hypothetical protein
MLLFARIGQSVASLRADRSGKGMQRDTVTPQFLPELRLPIGQQRARLLALRDDPYLDAIPG